MKEEEEEEKKKKKKENGWREGRWRRYNFPFAFIHLFKNTHLDASYYKERTTKHSVLHITCDTSYCSKRVLSSM
jgi:hypothetical protein